MHKPAQVQNVDFMKYVDALLVQARAASPAINRAAVAANADFFPAYLSNMAKGSRKSLLPLYGEGCTYEGITAALGTPWLTVGDLAAAGGMSLLDAPIIRASVNGGRIQPLTLTEAIFHNGRTVLWPRCPCSALWEEFLYQLSNQCPANQGEGGIREGLLKIAPLEAWALVAPSTEPAILQDPGDPSKGLSVWEAALDQAPAHAYAEHMHGPGCFDSVAYWMHVAAYPAQVAYFQQPAPVAASPEAVLYHLVQYRHLNLRVVGGLEVVGATPLTEQ